MEANILITPDNDPREWVGYDICGYPFNSKYPPNKKRYGQTFEGYPNKALGVLLYDFAVQGYDVELSYNGKTYYFMDAGDGVVTDSHFSDRKEVYDSPMALVENFKIDGKTLLELAPEIEDIEPV
ncbi:MAG: hypothetical protein K2M37_08030 [Muribaculaceae bacterium]|nr:hypothetical protein [Muribaculaceae bacterium]